MMKMVDVESAKTALSYHNSKANNLLGFRLAHRKNGRRAAPRRAVPRGLTLIFQVIFLYEHPSLPESLTIAVTPTADAVSLQ